jgi:hypothetical protein
MQSRTLGTLLINLISQYPPMLLITGIVLFFALASACTTDTELIREANQAAQEGDGQTSTSGTSSGSVSVFKIRTGDCIVDKELFELPVNETEESTSLKKVPCSDTSWDYKVLKSFTVARSGAYPGSGYFDDQYGKCPLAANTVIFPTRESWNLGDKTINCLQER